MPGPRDPGLTPYVIQPARAIASGLYRRVVLIQAGQSGKTDLVLDCVGSRADQSPVPMLYVGPTMKMITEQFEPRVVDLIEQSEALFAKRSLKRDTKTRKVIAGAPFRLAHAGSSVAMKSDPFELAFIDEYIEMLGRSKRAGRVLELVETRGESYAAFTAVITSTPSLGIADVERDPKSGLEFWKHNDEIECPAWQLWQQGTRNHWAWQCPDCREWFIPRSYQLRWADFPEGSPMHAKRGAYLECPRCRAHLPDSEKTWMNPRGQYVAPGQRISRDGAVHGEAREGPFMSYWVSGLASPFKSFGDRAYALRQAQESNDLSAVRTVINSFFGEIWAPTGPDTPEWAEVRACEGRYPLLHYHGEVTDAPLPAGVHFITAAVDVQKRSLIYAFRGWGARGTSWLLGYGELPGNTAEFEIWEDLADLLMTPIGGKRIRLALIDSGFRPDKPDAGQESIIYDFCRRYDRLVRPAKGASSRLDQPMRASRIDVAYDGKRDKYGLELIRIDTDWSKSWVHQHVRWQKDRDGAWFVGQGTDESYCRQIVSEARMRAKDNGSGKKPAQAFEWVRRSKQNHYLDIEAMNFVAGWMLRAHRIAPSNARTGEGAEPARPRVIPSALEPSASTVLETEIQHPARKSRVIQSPFVT